MACSSCVNAHAVICATVPVMDAANLMLSHKHTWWAYLTPADCFWKVRDWPTSPEDVSRGDSMLDYNHTSLTWHIMTLPCHGPATQHGWAQVAKQQAVAMSETPARGKAQQKWQWQTWRTKRVARCSSEEKKTKQSKTKKPPLPLSNLVTHVTVAQQLPSSFSPLIPSRLRKSLPVTVRVR